MMSPADGGAEPLAAVALEHCDTPDLGAAVGDNEPSCRRRGILGTSVFTIYNYLKEVRNDNK